MNGQFAFAEVIGLFTRFDKAGAVGVRQLNPVLDDGEGLVLRGAQPFRRCLQADNLKLRGRRGLQVSWRGKGVVEFQSRGHARGCSGEQQALIALLGD